MRKWVLAVAMIAALVATPALAAPCRTQGTADASIPFPNNDAKDVPFARAMAALLRPPVSDALPATLSCTRRTVETRLGRYVIGGENGDAFARLAFRADGKLGAIVYVATSSAAPGMFALVVQDHGLTIAKRFYAGVPRDDRLADDIRAALGDNAGIITYDVKRKLVSYSFTPRGGPPPVESGKQPDGSVMAVGPQILIPSTGNPRSWPTDCGTSHRALPARSSLKAPRCCWRALNRTRTILPATIERAPIRGCRPMP